jgi:hypothetical protein
MPSTHLIVNHLQRFNVLPRYSLCEGGERRLVYLVSGYQQSLGPLFVAVLNGLEEN